MHGLATIVASVESQLSAEHVPAQLTHNDGTEEQVKTVHVCELHVTEPAVLVDNNVTRDAIAVDSAQL